MIDDIIGKIEVKIQNASSIKDDNKVELLSLLKSLRSEVSELSETHAEHAESIASFTELSTHEATREVKNPQLLRLATKGLTTSVEEFELSHPRLVQIVNSICSILANLGI